jgi:ABC-type multidrug transport system ATPase subunit
LKNIIEVEKVSKQYNQREILKDVSFTIKKGSINGLLGPNGAGKTTIIRLLNGVIEATTGMMKVMSFDPKLQGDESEKGLELLQKVQVFIMICRHGIILSSFQKYMVILIRSELHIYLSSSIYSSLRIN